MKKSLLFFALCFTLCHLSMAQVVCIMCYDQNDSISTGVNNFILNGGFENSNCAPGYILDVFCPNSSYYSCDLDNWTCTGGGTSTYVCLFDTTPGTRSTVVEGNRAAYMGNYFCNPCSATVDDTSCFVTTDCELTGIPVGYPTHDPTYGGNLGVSIEQVVNGLLPGNTYVLEFWAGGENNANYFINPGMFGVDVGFGYNLLRCHQTPYPGGVGTRYIVEFNAVSTSDTIKFTSWGHVCSSCTELVLDDVRLYPLADLNPSVPPCAGATINALFNAPHHICPGTCTNFTNLSVNATSYQWTFAGATPSVSTDANPTNVCYNTPGNYAVTLIASNATASDTLTLNNYITVYPYPAPQGIAQSGDTLIANQGAVSYQWYHGGNLIPGATDYFYVATESGDYNVVATDANNCEVEAAIFDVVAGVSSTVYGLQFTVYPNPVGDKLEIRSWNLEAAASISIYNLLGEKVMAFKRQAKSQNQPAPINVSQLPSGSYLLEVSSDGKTGRTTFVKQ